jgi:dUTP pyrophosphatase
MIQFKSLSPQAKMPSKGSPGSAGYDISSVEELIILPGQRRLVDTGFSMAFEGNMYARIAPRSGLAVKGIDVGAGVIDSDYRGVVKVLLINNSQNDFKVNVGDRIAQMVFESLAMNTYFQQVEELGQTVRGSGGFGSTGIGEMSKECLHNEILHSVPLNGMIENKVESVFYVVRLENPLGSRSEIYNNLEECMAFLQKHPNAEYKEFLTMEDAKEYLKIRNFRSQKQKDQQKLFHIMNGMVEFL